MIQHRAVSVTSEIGDLEAVIIHTPGPEVENMTPQSAERALYSDILNLSVVSREYAQFRQILERYARTFEIRDLLTGVLRIPEARTGLIDWLIQNEHASAIADHLQSLPEEELCRQLLEGVPLVRDNLTRFLSTERYALQPLHNFFFTRDASMSVDNQVFIASLASQVREREAMIMETIFRFHPEVQAESVTPLRTGPSGGRLTLEGGDVLVVREDLLILGTGARTTTEGVDHVLEVLKRKKRPTHVLVQELPREPESFIHLDMVFTFLDREACLIYEPVVLNRHDFQTVHILVDNGRVRSIREENDLLAALDALGLDMAPIPCGGKSDRWTQEREQWHSGANFFALGPGKVMGYGRNVYTLEAMNNQGFEILSADAVLSGRVQPESYSRYAITVEGAELSRGGGGCRCMTMPLRRGQVDW